MCVPLSMEDFHHLPCSLSLSPQSQKNSEKARASAKNADQLYQESVKSLEESRALWEREMELLCRVRLP